MGEETEGATVRPPLLSLPYLILARAVSMKEALKKLVVAVIHLGESVIQYYMGALNSGDKYYDQRTQNHLKIGQAE